MVGLAELAMAVGLCIWTTQRASYRLMMMMMMIRFDTPQQYTTTTHHSSFALCHTCLSLACGCLPFDVRHRFLFVLLSFSDDFFFRCNWPALSPIFFFFLFLALWGKHGDRL